MWQPHQGARLRLLYAWILAWLAMATAAAAPPPVPLATDLAADARTAGERGQLVVVLFSRSGCGWCDKARHEHLNAMAADPAGAVFRQVDIDRDTPLIGFSGRRTSHRAFAVAHKARMTPTLMFFAADGRTLGDGIVGYRLPEFYGTLIENAIEDGRQRLRGEAN